MAKRDRDLTKTQRAQAAIKEQEAAERRRKMVMIGAIVAVLAIVVGLGVLLQSLRAKEKVDSAASPAGATETYGLLIGDENAKNKVVIYEDFLCPACGQFEAVSREPLSAAATAGKVSVEYRPFHLLRSFDYSQRSANAFWVVLNESGPEVAKEYHDLLFANQPSESGTQPDDAWLIDKAVEAGADKAAVEKGINNMQFEGFIARSDDAASRDKVTGTPTVRLNGKDVDGKDINDMLTNLLAAIEKS